MAGLNQTAEEYYSDESNNGGYQYTTLDNIIDTFRLRYVGDDKLIQRAKTYDIVGHAKRGLQTLNYDALKEVKVLELELSDSLELTLPQDYVNYVRVSTVDSRGNFRPILESTRSAIAKAYLQDHEYNILFDEEGNALEGSSIAQENALNISAQELNYTRIGYEEQNTTRQRAQYNLDTSLSNVNGTFTIDKRSKKIRFSSNIPSRLIVIEYISDGLEYADPKEIQIHKLAEEALYMWIRWQIVSNKRNQPEYVVRRTERDWNREYQKAKLRLSNFRPHQLVQALKGRNNWIK